MDIFSMITGVIMVVGAIAGIAVGVMKATNKGGFDGSDMVIGSHTHPTHAQVYAASHTNHQIPVVDPVRQQRIAENNLKYIQNDTHNNIPVINNIEPIYAPNASMMGTMPISSQTYNMNWSVPPTMFRPTPQYPPMYAPIPMSANAANDMCDVLKHVHRGPMPEDIIDTVLLSAERQSNKYGNVPGLV